MGDAPAPSGSSPPGASPHDRPPRTLVVWCPDWPITAAGVAHRDLAAVFHANRVVAASAAARHSGVRAGMRRRDAQRRCPDLEVLQLDPDRDAAAFEPVAAALDAVTPRIEITRPGVASFPTRGPSRFFGGDQALVDRVVEVVGAALGDRSTCQVGVADGAFAAVLAARVAAVVPACPDTATAIFLAPLPVSVLGRPDLADLLVRLGIRSLGAFAELAEVSVADRFGPDGVLAHRLARGLEERPLDLRPPPPDLDISVQIDPPAERVDQAAFVAKRLADELDRRLAEVGLSVTRVVIEAESDHGETLSRVWRHDGTLDAVGIAERARWQIDGWLSGSATTRPTGGLTRLRLVPDQVTRTVGRQLGFWGGDAAAAARAARGVARIQGLLGPGGVTVPRLVGGRGPVDRVRAEPVFPADLERMAATADGHGAPGRVRADHAVTEPWPGHVPAPAPAVVMTDAPEVQVVDGRGGDVVVDGRGQLSAAPATLVVDGHRHRVQSWAGPWPAEERWWDPDDHRRRARCQMVAGGRAHLVVRESGVWRLEASYD